MKFIIIYKILTFTLILATIYNSKISEKRSKAKAPGVLDFLSYVSNILFSTDKKNYFNKAKSLMTERNLLCNSRKDCKCLLSEMTSSSRSNVKRHFTKIFKQFSNDYDKLDFKIELTYDLILSKIKHILERESHVFFKFFTEYHKYISWYMNTTDFEKIFLNKIRKSNNVIKINFLFKINLYYKVVSNIFDTIIMYLYKKSYELDTVSLYGYYELDNKNSVINNLSMLPKNKRKILLSSNPLNMVDDLTHISDFLKYISKNNKQIAFFRIDNKNKKCLGMINNNLYVHNYYITKPYSMFEISEYKNIREYFPNDFEIHPNFDSNRYKFFKLKCLEDNIKFFDDADTSIIYSVIDLINN